MTHGASEDLGKWTFSAEIANSFGVSYLLANLVTLKPTPVLAYRFTEKPRPRLRDHCTLL
jgi:hypothetical protein